jgi:tRNA(Ile)-lysidine synthase
MGENDDVTDQVARTIEHYRMTASGPRVAVAVSGGADSVFLLHALHELSLAAAILHINHHLRDAESHADESFVRDLAERFNLPIHVLDAPIATGNIEQEARRARYDFFQTQIASGNCDAVATGHTLDDQAETVLYRFIRGAGTAGLSGILPVTQSHIIRPLIELRRTEIRAWLAERQIPWREDSSNSDTDLVRNRIRAHHLPELTASLNPALPEALAATASWARAEEDYWNAELERLAPLHLIRTPEALQEKATVLIDTAQFLELPVAVQRRLLRYAIEIVRGSLRAIDFRHVEAIRAMMFTREGSGRIQLPDLDVYRSFDWLRFAPIGYDSRLERDFETPLAIPGLTNLPERSLTIETELARKSPVYNSEGRQRLDPERSGSLDWDRCRGELTLRNWRPGDQYQRRGHSGAEKIKTLFQEFRVPLWERRRWPVIVRGSSILWTRIFGVAGEFAAGPGSGNILTIRETMESNPSVPASMYMSTNTNRNKNDKVNRARKLTEPGAGACKEVS